MFTLTQLESLPDWRHIAIVGIWLGVVLLLAAIIDRFTTADAEIPRKIVHIGTGNIILFAWLFHIPASVGIGASIVASLVTLLSYKFPILPGINSVGRQSLGTFFYAVSIGVLVAWFWYVEQPQYAALGILVMTWGDGLAALIGQRFGRHRYKILGIQKSWEGSLTMAVVSCIISSLILLSVYGNIWQTWCVALILAVVATSLEAFSKFGIDNLTVPIGTAAVGFVLMQLLTVA